MTLSETIASKKQLLQTIGLTSAAFLIALPIGAAVLPNNDVANADETTVTRTVENACVEGDGTGTGTGAVNGATNTVTSSTTTRTIRDNDSLVTVREVVRDVDVDANDLIEVGDINLNVDADALNGTDTSALNDTAVDVSDSVDGVLSELGL